MKQIRLESRVASGLHSSKHTPRSQGEKVKKALGTVSSSRPRACLTDGEEVSSDREAESDFSIPEFYGLFSPPLATLSQTLRGRVATPDSGSIISIIFSRRPSKRAIRGECQHSKFF